jgi:hypothetical protein
VCSELLGCCPPECKDRDAVRTARADGRSRGLWWVGLQPADAPVGESIHDDARRVVIDVESCRVLDVGTVCHDGAADPVGDGRRVDDQPGSVDHHDDRATDHDDRATHDDDHRSAHDHDRTGDHDDDRTPDDFDDHR